ncbi:SRPBCC family protein [Rhabdothermincola salaria]|uniref:SRPBCC family protein n=1 Tax=Rhabdothermincola salaria TaxID=2903142 RepID=UPI001E562700|nr:SRPBCC family protein [Rhabdothermincola salaria]MCD9624783.1 SRPBCC family protein [Rhabdothermincola salaria]
MDDAHRPDRTRRDEPWLVGREVSVDVARPADDVYALVSDPTRIGEWSPECHTAVWLSDERGVGARFKGTNRSGRNRWSRVCEVVEDRPGREFAYRTVPGFGPSADSSVWRFSVHPTDEGCRLTQSLQPVKPPQRWFRPIIRRSMPHHLDMREQMRATLEAIRATAEADTETRPRSR